MSTIEDRIEVVGTTDDLAHATSILRTGALTGAGFGLDPEGVGMVYVVRATDGCFL